MTDPAPNPPLTRYIAPAIITAFILIAIVIGLAPRGPKGNFIQSSEFQLAMDRAASGEVKPLPGRMRVTPSRSFLDGRQRWCRTFALSGTIEGGGIVCRQDGEWLIEARTPPGADTGPMEAAVARLNGTVPLAAAVERRIIATDWRSVR